MRTQSSPGGNAMGGELAWIYDKATELVKVIRIVSGGKHFSVAEAEQTI